MPLGTSHVYDIIMTMSVYILTLDPPPCVDLTMFTQFRGVVFSLHLMDLCPDEVLATCSLLFMVFTGTKSLRVLRTGKDTEHPMEKFSNARALIYIFFTFLVEQGVKSLICKQYFFSLQKLFTSYTVRV